MALNYLPNGNLIPGVHEITWDEFVSEFGYTEHRMLLLSGLKIALHALKECNCQKVYIDGSFTTTRERPPGDWDGCFDPDGVDIQMLYDNYPIFWDLQHPRLQQKLTFKGEIFPGTARANMKGDTYLYFFQTNKGDNSPKGIIQLLLQNFSI
jgi:hypothetical protein